jgi:hypothetical protein
VVGTRGQDADEAKLGNSGAARSDRQDGEQADESERGEARLPRDLRLGQAHAAHAREQHQPQCDRTRGRGGGDPPAARREEARGPLAESLQGAGGSRRRRLAHEPAAARHGALEHGIGAGRE